MLSVAVMSGLSVEPASAGTYTVLSCRDHVGRPTPANDASGGWTACSPVGPGRDASDLCGSSSPATHLEPSAGSWSLPGRDSMADVAFHGAVRTPDLEGADILYSGYARPFDRQNQGIDLVSRRSDSGLPGDVTSASETVAARWATSREACTIAWVRNRARCDGPTGNPDCQPGPVHATVEIFARRSTLADTSPPNAGAASGSAVTSPTWQGTMTFAFPTTDDGGGVYQAVLEVDGQPCWRRRSTIGVVAAWTQRRASGCSAIHGRA